MIRRFILETPSGGRALTFETLAQAQAELARQERIHGVSYRIIEQTIHERVL